MIKIPSLRITTVFILLSLALNIHANEYEDAADNWDSYQDVANWLNDNLKFNKQRQELIKERLQLHGPEGLLIRDPEKTFLNSKGYCADAAHFARESLNTIDPEYNAQWVFIDNAMNVSLFLSSKRKYAISIARQVGLGLVISPSVKIPNSDKQNIYMPWLGVQKETFHAQILFTG